MTLLRVLVLSLFVMGFPLTVVAHHGVSGQFDTSQVFEVTGNITQIRLVNPHAYVYFDVTDNAGGVTNMRCELLPGSTLKRNGWTEEMFVAGSSISVIGSPDRDDPTTCYMNQLTFANGVVATRDTTFADDGVIEVEDRELVRADGTPNIAGNWAMMGPEEQGGRGAQVTLTPAGEAAVVGASSDQNPRFNCKATNIIMDWWFNQNVNSISQSDTQITLRYGFMDLVRTIYLDDTQMPADYTPNRAGFSTGVWDGNTLIVTTTGFDEGWISAPLGGRGGASSEGGGDDSEAADRPARPEGSDLTERPERPEGSDRPERPARPEGSDRPERPEGGRGGPSPVKNSLELTVTERFIVSDDGTVLTREYALIDPLYLVGSIEGTDEVSLTTEIFSPYGCEDLTDEAGWGQSEDQVVLLTQPPTAAQTQTNNMGVLFALEDSFVGQIASRSIWGYPILLSLHAVGMAIMVGVSLMLLIRVLGFNTAIPVTAMLPFWRVALCGFVINLLSGLALFLGGASELFFNAAFWTKLFFVFLSLALTWRLVRICIARSNNILPSHRKVAAVAIATWVVAIISGRLIGYMS